VAVRLRVVRSDDVAANFRERDDELSFAKTSAALSPAIAPSQELIAVQIVTAGRLNIPTCVSAACLVLSVQGGTEQSLNNALPNTREQQVLIRATGTKNPRAQPPALRSPETARKC